MNKNLIRILSLLLALFMLIPLTAYAIEFHPAEGDEGEDDSTVEEEPGDNWDDGWFDDGEEDLPPDDGSEDEEPSQEGEYSGFGSRLMRVGIYYGSSGKDSVTLTLTHGDGFYFGYFEGDKEDSFVALDEAAVTEITVTAKNDVIYVKDSSGDVLYTHDQDMAGTSLGVEPYSLDGTKTVTKCGYPYYGSFRFECFSSYDGLMTIVNVVQLDDYVKGVVPYEMSPSWHVEALKVQAVCARSYALSHISAKHQKNFGFDLCDSDCCQVYRGVYSGSYIANVNEAVESTSGVVLMYDGEYCDTVYSSSNGGGSEAAKNVWGKDIPYLQGVVDPYEALIADKISNYYWSETFTGEELQAKLVASGRVSCGVITEVKTTLSETGNVTALTFVDDNDKHWTIYNTDGGGSKCRTFLSLRSIHYTVSSESGSETVTDGTVYANDGQELDLTGGITVISGDGTLTTITSGSIITADGVLELGEGGSDITQASGEVFTFSGSGWGHNVGMSQYGAYAMAQIGYTYDEILEFYYTGAMIEQC